MNDYVVIDKTTNEPLTPVFNKSLESCRKFRKQLNNSMRKKTCIMCLGWYEVK